MKIVKLLMVLVLTQGVFSCAENKNVYVDSQEVMEGFDFYKEFEEVYKKRLTASQAVLDSMRYDLSLEERIIYQNGDIKEHEEFIAKRNEYLRMETQHSEAIEAFYENEMTKIMERLNGYFIDYGKLNQYDYILGANGQGVLLYADTTQNITKEFIDYANGRYAGLID